MVNDGYQLDGYQLIDSGEFQKLEQIGPYLLVRPSPQAVWPKRMTAKEWDQADAKFVRSKMGKVSGTFVKGDRRR